MKKLALAYCVNDIMTHRSVLVNAVLTDYWCCIVLSVLRVLHKSEIKQKMN